VSDDQSYRKVLRWIERSGKASVTKREIYEGVKGGATFKKAEALDAPLRSLEQHGIIRRIVTSDNQAGRPTEAYEISLLAQSSEKPTEKGSTVDSLDRLIDRILQRQERRTPGYVLRSQAMQRILVRLDTALEADEVTLRAEVAAVIHDLGDVIQWEG
jgi:hypothetical protein